MREILLQRDKLSEEEPNLGTISIASEKIFHTLELPWKKNAHEISCIPAGQYLCNGVQSAKFGKCYHLQNVPHRSDILIHIGNFPKDTRGCILLGEQRGQLGVLKSRDAMKRFLEFLGWPERFLLTIKNMPEKNGYLEA